MRHISHVMGSSTVTTTTWKSHLHAFRLHRHQVHWSVNAWTGVLCNRMIRSYLLNERLTRHSHFVFLRDVWTDYLDDLPLSAINDLWFHYDRAPVDFSFSVRDWLDMEYPRRWMDVVVRFYGRYDSQIWYLWMSSYGGHVKKWSIEI